MNRSDTSRAPRAASHSGVLFALLLGILAGMLVLALSELETRWIVYGVGGIGFFTILAVLPDKEKFAWMLFVFSLQLDLSIRFLHGYNASQGIEFHGAFLSGALFFIIYLQNAERGEMPLQLLGKAGPVIIAMIAVFVLSGVASHEHFVAFRSMVVYAEFFALYFFALNYVHEESRLLLTVRLLLVIVIIQSIIMYVQSALGITFTLTGEVLAETALPRPGGTVGTTPAAFATFHFPLCTIAAACAVSHQIDKRTRTLATIALILGSVALILTYTRAAWVGYALGLTWVTVFTLRFKLMRPWVLTLLGTGAAIAAAIAIPIILTARSDNPLETAFDERFALMKMAMNVISANPLAGVGPGAYGFSYKFYLTPELADNWLFVVHNTYLLFAAELGIPGGLVLITWLLTGIGLGLVLARQAVPPLLKIVGVGISAGFVSLAWEMYWEPLNGLRGMTILVPYWFLLGVLAAQFKQQRSATR